MASERTPSQPAAAASEPQPATPACPTLPPDPEALLCALVLVPETYARNRFFDLFEAPSLSRVRRRAKRVRGIIRQLLGHGRQSAVILSENVQGEQVLMRFQVRHLNYERTTSLTRLEASLVHFALHKGGGTQVSDADRQRVELALGRLNQGVDPSETK
ncbi:MAG: hypothetical protein RJA70_3682 [Pseudomonadota bacterium]|jgi:hypothetical protein